MFPIVRANNEGLTLEKWASETFHDGQFTFKINSADKTKFSCYIPNRRTTTVSLEIYTLS